MKVGVLMNRFVGVISLATAVLVICNEWALAVWATPLKTVFVLILVFVLTFQVSVSRKAFVFVGVLLSGVLVFTNSDWMRVAVSGLNTAAFVGAFFIALSTLRNVAESSAAIQRAGAFLAGQRPGRRYAALTVGGQAFSLLLSYGSMQLLGGLAFANADKEPDAEIRKHRMRRMLLAIQRAFVSTLPWSPLSFGVAISTTVIPDTSWSQIVWPGLVNSFILAGTGWALDTAFKPQVSRPSTWVPPQGTWATLLPLAMLLTILVVGVGVMYAMSDVRIIGIVVAFVPMVAVVWLFIQHWSKAPLANVASRVGNYVQEELPSYRNELILLLMAGYIGTVGAEVLLPTLDGAGVDLSVLPPWIILASLVWIIPVLGQVGMNPIMAVTLLGPLIPSAGMLGVEPTAIVVALTSGWALSGATSPFTATTLIIGSFANMSGRHVGTVWNRSYALTCYFALTGWVLIYSFAI